MKKSPKISKFFECDVCDYICSKQSEYIKHLATTKHKNRTNLNKICEKISENKQFICKNCNKTYNARNSLWYHEKNCSNKMNNIDNIIEQTNNQINEKDDLINYLIKENQEFKNLILEIVKKDTYNSTTNTNNSHNKTFNLQFFLNETCKDAMNIMDFVESIQLQLSDLENVGKLGYVEGITTIITKNLQALDVTQRPIHCTDKKREVLYIKDADKWEKEDDDKKKIRRAIKRVASKNHRLILKFKEAHPDCLKASSNYSDQYNKIIIESCGGSGDNDMEKEDKIIRNISKTVIVDK